MQETIAQKVQNQEFEKRGDIQVLCPEISIHGSGGEPLPLWWILSSTKYLSSHTRHTLLRRHREGSCDHFMKHWGCPKALFLTHLAHITVKCFQTYCITLPFFFIINTSKLPTSIVNDSQDSHISFMEHSSALYFSSNLFYLVNIFPCKYESLCLPLFLPNALGPCNGSCGTA